VTIGAASHGVLVFCFTGYPLGGMNGLMNGHTTLRLIRVLGFSKIILIFDEILSFSEMRVNVIDEPINRSH
jgi:hypothetical protein